MARQSAHKKYMKWRKRVLLSFKLIILCLLLVFIWNKKYKILYYSESLYYKLRLMNNSQQNHNLSDFGIPLPRQFKIHGIDISHHQERIDWGEVRRMKIRGDSISFVFMKATEGAFHIDPVFKENWEKAHKNNLVCGAYHYFKPKTNVKLQASIFRNIVKLKKGDLPPVLDVEESQGLSKKELLKKVNQWLKMIETAYGVKPLIYTNISFYNQYFSSDFDQYPFWIAHYYRDELIFPRDKHWTLWQHNDRGKVNGISGKVDFNVFNGSYEDFCRMCVK